MPVSGIQRRQVNKTADYTINADRDRSGTIFTTFGASGAVVFTLPTANARTAGWEYIFIGGADQNVQVASVADTLLCTHDAAADTLTLSTSSQKLGGSLRAICLKNASGYQWWACADNGTGTIAS